MSLAYEEVMKVFQLKKNHIGTGSGLVGYALEILCRQMVWGRWFLPKYNQNKFSQEKKQKGNKSGSIKFSDLWAETIILK